MLIYIFLILLGMIGCDEFIILWMSVLFGVRIIVKLMIRSRIVTSIAIRCVSLRFIAVLCKLMISFITRTNGITSLIS